MEWEPEARQAIDRAPFFVRGMARRRVEEMVAAEGRRVVTLADVRRAKDRQISSPVEPPDARPSAPPEPPAEASPDAETTSGLSEAEIRRIEQLAESLAGHESRFASIKGCGGAVGCPLALLDVQGITDRIVAAVEESGLAEALAARTKGPVLSHHKFKAAIAGCPNSCSEPQIRDFALIARARSARAGGECVGCGACEEACRESAVRVRDSEPSFDRERCVGCGACGEVCPSGAIATARGYDVLVGGRLGRHPRLALTVAEGASEEAALAILERALALLKAAGRPGERLGQVLDRVGLERLG